MNVPPFNRELAAQAIDWAAEGPHPNEPSIEPGLAPGGLVFQTWAHGKLLVEDRIRGDWITSEEEMDRHDPMVFERAESAGELAEQALDSTDVVELRTYDGDTGAWVGTRMVLRATA